MSGRKSTEVSIKIETYWNVNVEKVFFLSHAYCIKIETYWNVNVVL